MVEEGAGLAQGLRVKRESNYSELLRLVTRITVYFGVFVILISLIRCNQLLCHCCLYTQEWE